MGIDDPTRDSIVSRFMRPVGKSGANDYAPDIHPPSSINNIKNLIIL